MNYSGEQIKNIMCLIFLILTGPICNISVPITLLSAFSTHLPWSHIVRKVYFFYF